MEPLAKLVVSFVELAETELAILKRGVVRLGLSLVFVIAAGVLGTIGICWILNALFLVIADHLGRPAAFAISGLAFLGGAAVLLVLAMKTRKPAAAAAPTVSQTETAPPHSHPAEGNPNDPASLRIAS